MAGFIYLFYLSALLGEEVFLVDIAVVLGLLRLYKEFFLPETSLGCSARLIFSSCLSLPGVYPQHNSNTKHCQVLPAFVLLVLSKLCSCWCHPEKNPTSALLPLVAVFCHQPNFNSPSPWMADGLGPVALILSCCRHSWLWARQCWWLQFSAKQDTNTRVLLAFIFLNSCLLLCQRTWPFVWL